MSYFCPFLPVPPNEQKIISKLLVIVIVIIIIIVIFIIIIVAVVVTNVIIIIDVTIIIIIIKTEHLSADMIFACQGEVTIAWNFLCSSWFWIAKGPHPSFFFPLMYM